MTGGAREGRLPDAEATAAAGAALARAWRAAGSPALTVALEGDLGAGKTTFVRGLLRALGVTGPVRSPTYTLLESYRPTADTLVHHLDFYRLGDPGEAEELGFRELGGPRTLIAVEWASQVAAPAAMADLVVVLRPAGDGRAYTVEPVTPEGTSVDRRWVADDAAGNA